MDCIQIPMSLNSIGSDLAFTLITSSLKRCYIHTCTDMHHRERCVCVSVWKPPKKHKKIYRMMLNNVWNTIKFCLRQSIRSFILFDYRVSVCLLCILNIFCALFSSHFISLSCHSLHCISHPLDWFCLQKRSTSLSWPETMNTHTPTALSLSLSLVHIHATHVLPCTFLLVFCHFALSFGLFHLFYWIFVCNK